MDDVRRAPGAAARVKPAKVRGRRFAQLAGILAQRPYRPAALAIAGAAAGLVVATLGIFHPASHDRTSAPAGVAALVNQEPILMSDFIMETETAAGAPYAQTTPAERAAMLRKMIDNELMVQRSLALDLPEQDTEVRSALVDGVTSQVNAGVAGASITDDELIAFFNTHREKYTTAGSMTVTDLVLHVGGFENTDQSVDQALADAKQAVYDLRSGQTADYVKAHFGFVESGKVNGEEEDFAAKLHLGPKLYAVASPMTDGEVSEPVADTDGVHVMIMQHRRQPVAADFASVRNNVYSDYVASQQAKAQAANLKFLRSNAQIILAPGQSE